MEPNQQPTPQTPPVESPPTPEQPVAPAPEAAPVESTLNQPVVQENTGKTLGIVSLVLSIVGIGLVGLILGIVAMKKSKAAGQNNGIALAGIIVGVVNVIVTTLVIILLAYGGITLAQKCSELGAGTHEVGGVTYTCPE